MSTANPRTIQIVGHAKLRQGTISGMGTESGLAVSVTVERIYGVIIDCNSTLAIEEVRSYLRQLVIGYSLLTDLPEITRVVHEHFIGLTGTAFVAALADAQRTLMQWRAQHSGDEPPAADMPPLGV